MQNKISAVLTDQDRDDAIAAIEAAKNKMPFLMAVPTDQKQGMRKLGPASVDFVTNGLAGAQMFTNALRADFPLAEFKKDVDLINQLAKVRIYIAALLEGVEDTITLVGSDAMISADVVYDYLKKAAKSDSNAKDLVAKMAVKYEAQSKPKKKAVKA